MSRQHPALLFADRAREIAEFCLRHSGKAFNAFEGWNPPLLFSYVFFHVVARTVFMVRKHGGPCGTHITAVAFAWSNPETEIRKRAAAGSPQFDWRRTEDAADSLFVAQVIVKSREGNLARLARQVGQRWPDWQQRKIFTYRPLRGGHQGLQLVELRPAVIAKLTAD